MILSEKLIARSSERILIAGRDSRSGGGGVSVMNVKRQKKTKKREDRNKRQQAMLKEEYSRIFEAIGVSLDVKRLSEPAQNLLFASRSPQPDVTAEIEGESPERIEEICCAVRDTLKTTTFLPPGGHDITAHDFFRYCVGLRDLTSLMVRKKWERRFGSEFAEAKLKLDAFCNQIIENDIHMLMSELDAALAPFSRLDTAIYWFTPKTERNGIGKALFSIKVHKTKAQMLKLTSDRGTRPAYRVGASIGLHGLYWCCVPRRLFGVDSDGFYPVYIQDHAILRLHDRLPLPGWEGEVRDSISISLIDPKLSVGPSGDRLIEYRFYDWKLGYLPVEIIDDKILIKTFLFLTMTGTPEAKLLYRNCGLMRRDIEELSFDTLDTFVNTDVQEDQELQALLTRCGCGHLLELASLDDRTELIRGRAGQIRRYLGMKTI
jgi:hypothetical protein